MDDIYYCANSYDNDSEINEQSLDAFLDDSAVDDILDTFTEENPNSIDWQDFKEKVNDAAVKFSSATSNLEQLKSRDLILKYLGQMSCRVGDKEPKTEEEKRKLAVSLNFLKEEFPGFTGIAVRFAGRIYPDELWYKIVNRSLGFGIGKKGQLLKGTYDHTKGSKYTTYLFNLLNWAKTDWQEQSIAEQTNRMQSEWHPDKSVGAAAIYDGEGNFVELEGYCEDDYLVYTTAMQIAVDRTIDLAHLTKSTFSYAKCTSGSKDSSHFISDRGITATDNLKGLINSRLEILQLYYTQSLINATRYPIKNIKINTKDRSILTEVSNKDFCLFSTTLTKEQSDDLEALALAKLSEEIISKKLYNLGVFNVKVLSDGSIAVFLRKSKSDVSERLQYIKELLAPAIEHIKLRY